MSTPPAHRPLLIRFTPELAILLLLAAVAWTATVHEAVAMGNGPGTMGLAPGPFIGVWGLMMAAMMLPSVAPLATMHARSFGAHRIARLAGFTGGYLVVWGLTGVPAYFLMLSSGSLARHDPSTARLGAAALLILAGLWQFSRMKDYFLTRCRSPVGLLLHYGSYHGPLREVRVAAHHASYCLGCCWALMALFVVFGMMNLAAMVGLSVVVLLEKLAGHERGVARVVGSACLVLAALSLAVPSIAPGLQPLSPMPMG